MRGSGSVLGAAETWVKCTIDGASVPWRGSEEEARQYARDLNANCSSPNVGYQARRYA